MNILLIKVNAVGATLGMEWSKKGRVEIIKKPLSK
jgi:hypothetical protein